MYSLLVHTQMMNHHGSYTLCSKEDINDMHRIIIYTHTKTGEILYLSNYKHQIITITASTERE